MLNGLIEKYHFLERYLLCYYHWYIVDMSHHLLLLSSQVQGRCWYLVQMITRLITAAAGGGGGEGIVTSCLITKHWLSLSCAASVVWHCLARSEQMLFIFWISGEDWSICTASLYLVMGNLWSNRWFYSGRLGQVISQTIWLGFQDIYYDLIMIWHSKDGEGYFSYFSS